MFISNAELKEIRSQIKFLQELAMKFASEINWLMVQQGGPSRKGREWSQEQRKKQSDFMKQRHANAKAKKAQV